MTALIFSYAAAPPLVFAVMPMFAWLAFRGTLREATLLLASVGVGGHRGDMHRARPRADGPLLAGTRADDRLPPAVPARLRADPAAALGDDDPAADVRSPRPSGQQTLQRLVDAATGSAVIATDLDGRIELFNPGAEAVMGMSAAEAIGVEADRLFPDAELLRQAHARRRPVFAEICAASVGRREERQLWHFERPDGEQRSMLMAITSVPDDRGGVAGYLCVAEDVTEREAIHRSLVTALSHERQAVDSLRELERVKADFVATVSHELRTPLTSMMGYIELLEEGDVVSSPPSSALSPTGSSATGAVAAARRGPAAALADRGPPDADEPGRFRPSDVGAGGVRVARPPLGTRHLEVVLRLPDQPVLHVGDPDQSRADVLHLLGNAVKFTPDGGRVELVVGDRHDSVEIVVLDTGMGIPDGGRPAVHSLLPLLTAIAQGIRAPVWASIVRGIVDLHDGEISVSSSEGIGTTVSVSLPRQDPPARPRASG